MRTRDSIHRKNSPFYGPERFTYQPESNSYRCRAGQPLNYGGRNTRNRTYTYIGTRKRCGACALKAQCTSGAFRFLAIHMDEPARQRARELANTPEFAKAQRESDAAARHPAEHFLHRHSPNLYTHSLLGSSRPSSVTVALAQLHAKRITHRDIKPANLLIYQGRSHIGDFGLVDYPTKPDITIGKEQLDDGPISSNGSHHLDLDSITAGSLVGYSESRI